MKIFYPKAAANIAIVPRGANDLVSSESIIPLGTFPVRSMRVVSNNVFTADEFSCEIDGHYFPADVRSIRCMAVDLHIADVKKAGAMFDIKTDATRLLVGHVDEISSSYKNQDYVVKIKGRDYTGLFLDNKWQGRVVTLNRSLTEIVTEIKNSIPSTSIMKIAEDYPVMVLGTTTTKKDKNGKKKITKHDKYRAQASMTVWEGMQQLAIRAGAILEIHGDKLYIRRPRTIDKTSTIPQFVEGKNISSLEVTRNLGKNDLPNIRVRCWDPKKKKTIIGQWPKDPRPTVRATKSKKKEDVDWQNHIVTIPNPTIEQLTNIAKSIYTHAAFEQITVRIETKDMWATDNETRLPVEMTDIRNGTSLRLHIDTKTRRLIQHGLNPSQIGDLLKEQGYSAEVAKTLSDRIELFDSILFVDKATHSYSNSSGYSLSIDAINVLDGAL